VDHDPLGLGEPIEHALGESAVGTAALNGQIDGLLRRGRGHAP
jgi:hypothetical protein